MKVDEKYVLLVVMMQRDFWAANDVATQRAVWGEMAVATERGMPVMRIEQHTLFGERCRATHQHFVDLLDRHQELSCLVRSNDDYVGHILRTCYRQNWSRSSFKVVGVNTDCVGRTIALGLKDLDPKRRVELVQSACHTDSDDDSALWREFEEAGVTFNASESRPKLRLVA